MITETEPIPPGRNVLWNKAKALTVELADAYEEWVACHTKLCLAHKQNHELQCKLDKLKNALQFYADCEWGQHRDGNCEPMILRLPNDIPDTLDREFAGSVAIAALEGIVND